MVLLPRHKERAKAVLVFLIQGCMGAYLFWHSYPTQPFSENQRVWDLQWLNAWSLVFLAIVIAIWNLKLKRRTKALLTVGGYSLYGVVAVAVLFNGTPFGWNAYWGDQQFRTAMILKFVSFAVPVDFYYKDLPPFYPPLYYYVLSLYARIASVEAFKMIKIGSQFIFLLTPTLLYYFWSKLVSHLQALSITLASFLLVSHMVLSAPHEFMATVFFIPWWLYYVDQIHKPAPNWRHYIVGGIIGGALFMTYYYAFFVGGLVLVTRSFTMLRRDSRRAAVRRRVKRAWTVLVSAAVVSALYWLPLLLSFVTRGLAPSQNRWFHIGYAEMDFMFFEFSLTGLLFFIGIIHCLRRYYAPIYKSLLSLVAAVVGLYLLGYVLGNLDAPVLYIKAHEFLYGVGAVMIGSGAATLLRLGQMRKKVRYATAIGVSILILFFLNEFTQLVRFKEIEVARMANSNRWLTKFTKLNAERGHVFLTDKHPAPAFFPVFFFIAPGEHASHHAGQFQDRFNFLSLLQTIDDSYLFYIALRHNLYDQVDGIMAGMKDDHFEIPVVLSNYPNRNYTKVLRFSRQAVSDKVLFVEEPEISLYRLADESKDTSSMKTVYFGGSTNDSLLRLDRLKVLRRSLDSYGRRRVDQYVAVDWTPWHQLYPHGNREVNFGKSISLVSADAVEAADSTHLLLAFLAHEDINVDYKISLCLYSGKPESVPGEFDFMPAPRTSTWKRGDIVLCRRSVPTEHKQFSLRLGFSRGGTWLGKAFRAHVNFNDNINQSQ